jgi:CheY-like chemotaxis protein
VHTILIADRSLRDVDLSRSYLSRTYCNVVTAGGLEEALAQMRLALPDLVVADLVESGETVPLWNLLRSSDELRQIPLLVFTASRIPPELEQAGVSAILEKPLDEEQFLAAVRRFVPLADLREPRVATRLSAVGRIDSRDVPLRVINLSRGGAKLKSVFALPKVGGRFVLKLDLSTDNGWRKIQPTVIVVRCEIEKEIGVRFLKMEADEKAAVDEFVSDVLEEAFRF